MNAEQIHEGGRLVRVHGGSGLAVEGVPGARRGLVVHSAISHRDGEGWARGSYRLTQRVVSGGDLWHVRREGPVPAEESGAGRGLLRADDPRARRDRGSLTMHTYVVVQPDDYPNDLRAEGVVRATKRVADKAAAERWYHGAHATVARRERLVRIADGHAVSEGDRVCSYGHWLDPLNGGIDQVIAGSESGPKAREAHEDWYRIIRDQCRAAGVAFFLKQFAEGGKKRSLPVLDGEQHAEFPEVRDGQ